jgi:uncharacterized protein YcbK (DUF882 family)
MLRRRLFGLAAGIVALAAVQAPSFAAAEGERHLALYNPHTDERFDDVYWCNGGYVAGALKRIDWLMRDFHPTPWRRSTPISSTCCNAWRGASRRSSPSACSPVIAPLRPTSCCGARA